jgi:subtilisin family serine protease
MPFIRHILFLFACYLLSINAHSQHKYWIVFKDKLGENTPAISSQTAQYRQLQKISIDESDFCVSKLYINELTKINIPICQKSRWLNAVSAILTNSQLTWLKKQSFVENIVPIDINLTIAKTDPTKAPNFTPVMTQIQAEKFREMGLTGKNITIGVIDAGYFEAHTSPSLTHLFERTAILDKKDYVNPDHLRTFYTNSESFSDFHGTEVLAAIAGLDRSERLLHGLAIDAKFYLARTDHGTHEWRGEEDNWVAAIEWLDSLGVRLVNTSLGYAKGFSDPKENYQPAQMNGHTSLISKAAQIAVDKKGILLVVSAGNEGDDPDWRIISTPADAEGVLTIGATNQKSWNRIGYSSIGPDFLPYLKPNVSCFSQFGTSLSAPVITGFAACIMQADPTLSNKQIKAIIEKSAHLYPFGNNFVGYGVPLASRALALLSGTNKKGVENQEINAKDRETITLALPETTELVTIYHKKTQIIVTSQELIRVRNGQLTIKRQDNETHTTIDLKSQVFEVVWK